MVGNRLSSLNVSPYNYNSSNELTSTPSGSYSYDNNGNRKSDPTGAQYTWDYENRLTQVVLAGSGGTVNFKYDPFGRRIQKAFTQNSTTTTTNYVYDDRDILETTDQSGNVLARYTGTIGVDEPSSELVSGSMSYYEQDGINSVTSLSNTVGALANTYTYDSYGKLTASTGTASNLFQYTGRDYDAESGLRYYRARYYDPVVGRFTGEDPLRFVSDVNFYRYVFNNPISFTDPLGLTCTCTYHQSTGAIRCVDDTTGDVVAQGTGYSGFGPGLNNPAAQAVPNTGPIPQGSYSMGSPTNRKGPTTIPLTPFPGTDTLGRSGFLIHGDNSQMNHTASHGCIVLSRDVRRVIADCGGGTVSVEE